MGKMDLKVDFKPV
jgi:hypothetical protein